MLRDLDGGTISSVTYSSRDPITRTLKSFSIDLTSNPTLAGLLTQTRGEAVEVSMTGGNRITGSIIGVETRQAQTGPKGDVAGEFLTLNTQTGITSLALIDVQGIRFLRKEVQDDLAQALQVLSSSHGIEKKKVVLHFTGTGKRRVRIGYILESPVWKTSYRLVLADKSPHLLQGWAMVENTSDTDWRSVALTLVSGRPITFIMDLYQPLYLQRPDVQLELYQSLRPQTNQMAMEEKESAADAALAEEAPMPEAAPAPAAKSAAAPRALAGSGFAAGPGGGEFSVSQGVAAAASGAQVGELFQYAIDKPVTLPRQQSAMLPILNQQVTGERYSLYNESTHPKYPLNAVKLKNTSSLHLMQGPITVFDGGTYAGDAQITDLAPGAEQLVTYAMDLDTEVEAAAGRLPGHARVREDQQGSFLLHEQAAEGADLQHQEPRHEEPDGAHRAPLPAGLDPGRAQRTGGAHTGRVPFRRPRCRGKDREALRCGDPHGRTERFPVQPRGRPGRVLPVRARW